MADNPENPGAGSLALTGLVPTVVFDWVVYPAVGSLVLTEIAPTVTFDWVVHPGVGSLALTGVAPIIVVNEIVAPAVGSLALSSAILIITNNNFEADLTSPIPIVLGQSHSGQLIVGDVQVPLALVDVTSGFTAFVQPSVPVVIAAGLTGRVGIGVVNNIRARVTGVLSQQTLTIGEIITASPIILGEMLPGTLNVGDIQNRFSIVTGVGLSGGIGAGAFNSPLLEVNATFVTEIDITGEILIPLFDIRGNGLIILSDSVTWVLNTESNRVTNYTQFPFIALGLLGANPIGATIDGLYLLSGDNDNGQSIDSIFKFGMTDFRSELINNADVYVGGDIESDMEISIREDGQCDENTYILSERERHARGHRAKLGKGFRSRYRQLSISNVNGGNFELDSLSLSSRDLRGNE